MTTSVPGIIKKMFEKIQYSALFSPTLNSPFCPATEKGFPVTSPGGVKIDCKSPVPQVFTLEDGTLVQLRGSTIFTVPTGVKLIYDIFKKAAVFIKNNATAKHDALWFETQLNIERIADRRAIHRPFTRKDSTQEFYQEIRNNSYAKRVVETIKKLLLKEIQGTTTTQGNLQITAGGGGKKIWIPNNNGSTTSYNVPTGVAAIWQRIQKAEANNIAYADALAQIGQIAAQRLNIATPKRKDITKNFYLTILQNSKEFMELTELTYLEFKNQDQHVTQSFEFKKFFLDKYDQLHYGASVITVPSTISLTVPKEIAPIYKIIDSMQTGKLTPAATFEKAHQIAEQELKKINNTTKRSFSFFRFFAPTSKTVNSEALQFFNHLENRKLGNLLALSAKQQTSSNNTCN